MRATKTRERARESKAASFAVWKFWMVNCRTISRGNLSRAKEMRIHFTILDPTSISKSPRLAATSPGSPRLPTSSRKTSTTHALSPSSSWTLPLEGIILQIHRSLLAKRRRPSGRIKSDRATKSNCRIPSSGTTPTWSVETLF